MLSVPAVAASIDVYVGYADGLRGPVNYPNPWSGDSGVTFIGDYPAASNSGAIMIVNTSGGDVAINTLGVFINGTDCASNPNCNAQTTWALSLPVTLHAGDKLIVTQTSQYNFDTSDIAYIPGATYGTPATSCAISCPEVFVNGIGLFDSGHILDTGGFDYALNGSNESFGWRLIGTTGIDNPTNQIGIPEPLTLSLFGMGIAGAVAIRRRRKYSA